MDMSLRTGFDFNGLYAGVSINYRIHVNIWLVITGFQITRIVSRYKLGL
jgi:hypothetical protein